MYNYIPIIFGGIMFILGLVMAINPKGSTKKELREDMNIVAKTKKNGYIVIICGLMVLIVSIIRLISI